MSSAEIRAAWKAAHKEVAEIEAERAALVAHTEDRYRAANDRLEEIEEAHGAPIVCEGCQDPIFDDDPYLGGDTPLCEQCAPTYEDLIKDPAGFVGCDGNPLTFKTALVEYNKHLAAGGKPTDSMAELRP